MVNSKRNGWVGSLIRSGAHRGELSVYATDLAFPTVGPPRSRVLELAGPGYGFGADRTP